MFYIREFEFYESDGYVCAVPFGLGGGTFGDDLDDAVDSAADYLREAVDGMLIAGAEVPEPTFGNEPEHGGKVIAIAVDCDLDKVDSMTAADAARALGVSRARVAQMCESGMLQSWKDGGKRLVTRDSVEARLAEQPQAGRPRKEAAKA